MLDLLLMGLALGIFVTLSRGRVAVMVSKITKGCSMLDGFAFTEGYSLRDGLTITEAYLMLDGLTITKGCSMPDGVTITESCSMLDGLTITEGFWGWAVSRSPRAA